MKTSEDNPADWLLLAKERLESADALFTARGACYSAVELLQESVERYLKGFLISRGWQLERIHDLNRLLDLTIAHHADFSRFQKLAQSLTEQYWEQHYPGGDLDEVGQDYPELRHAIGELVALIESAIPAL
jgi:HEPN domain-containing protein